MGRICQEKPVTVTDHCYSKTKMNWYLRCYMYNILSLHTQFIISLEFFWALLVSVVLLLPWLLSWFSYKLKNLTPSWTEECRICANHVFYNIPTFFVCNTDLIINQCIKLSCPLAITSNLASCLPLNISKELPKTKVAL